MSTFVTVNGRSHQMVSIVTPTFSTAWGAARVRTPTGPIGQSLLSMSMVCLARRPCGVLIWMGTPYAASVGAGRDVAHPQARAATRANATVSAVARRRAPAASRRSVGPRNVKYNFELQQ